MAVPKVPVPGSSLRSGSVGSSLRDSDKLKAAAGMQAGQTPSNAKAKIGRGAELGAPINGGLIRRGAPSGNLKEVNSPMNRARTGMNQSNVKNKQAAIMRLQQKYRQQGRGF